MSQYQDVGKEKPDFPMWKAIKPDLNAEFERYIEWATFESNGRLSTLLTSPVTFVNEALAKFYGIEGVTGSALVRVEDPTHRTGVFSLGAFLATHAGPTDTSPIRRGVLLREQLLCQTPPPPPDNVNTKLPKATALLPTLRDRLEDHRSDVVCAKCHRLFDPLGFAFESYDAVGHRRRTGDQARQQ